MNGGRERQTLRTVKVSLDAARAAARCRVEVNANEDRVPIRVGDRDASPQGHENVAVSGHHDSIPVGNKDRFEPLRYIQIHGFFLNKLARNSAAIESAMAGVDHDSCRRTVSFGNGNGPLLRCGSRRCSRRNGVLFSRGERTGSGQTIDSRGNERPGER